MDKYKIVDLFAGAGGLSLGFLSTNKFQIEMAVEINKQMQKTYYRNHKDVNIREEDIVDVVKRIDEIKTKLGEVDVVVGGPPCQGFSNANRQKNSLVSNNNNLVKEYVKFIRAVQPKVFVFENVKTIASDKHKFFVTEDDGEMIDKLRLKKKNKDVTIGEVNILTKLLLDYINGNSMVNLKDFILKKEIYIELNAIIKNDVNSINKIEKLKGLIPKWDEYHIQFLNEEYMQQWNSIKESYENNHFEQCLVSIRNIIEVQKVINKLNEIVEHRIVASHPKIKEEDIVISVETYNVYDFLIESFKDAGYTIDEGILNAVNYGVPQSRERFIVIGVRNDIITASSYNVKLPESKVKEIKKFTTVYDAISDLENLEPDKEVGGEAKAKLNTNNSCPEIYSNFVSDSEFIYNHINTNTRDTALERFKQLDEGQNFHDLTEEYKNTYTNPKRTQNTVYQRLRYDSQSGTVVNVRKSMWIHPKKHRALSIREAARLQSFPDSYVFEGTKDAQYQQVGNAVPPLLGKAIAEKVIELLE